MGAPKYDDGSNPALGRDNAQLVYDHCFSPMRLGALQGKPLRTLAGMFIFAALLHAQDKTEPLNVCEVLSKLSSYRGQRITVRGEFVGGEEGSVLIGGGCRPVVTDGHTWPVPTPIALTFPGSPGSGDSRAPSPKPRIEQFDSGAVKSAGPGAKVYVTVTGRLDTKAHFEMVHLDDGRVVPYGYGHLAACVAQIVYEEMKDFAIVPAKQ